MGVALMALGLLRESQRCAAQEPPYFVTYSHAMEEPGNLEVEFKGTQAAPKNDNAFGGGDGGVRVRREGVVDDRGVPERADDGERQHDLHGLSLGEPFSSAAGGALDQSGSCISSTRTSTRRTGAFWRSWATTAWQDLLLTNAQARSDVEREMEMKLILSSNAKGWNFSENFITEKKHETSEPWEFGYAVAASRPLSLRAGARECAFCRENFAAGAEMYGGLGTTDSFGLKETSHYVGADWWRWNIPRGPTIQFSPSFGLNDNSMKVLWRVGVQYEFQQFFSRFHQRGGSVAMRRSDGSGVLAAWVRGVAGGGGSESGLAEESAGGGEGAENPYAGQADAVAAGGRLYADHCARCHGADLRGRARQAEFEDGCGEECDGR